MSPPDDWYKCDWPTFLCSYRYQGSEWSFDLLAEDLEDAKARLQAIRALGQVDGKLEMKIPLNPATSIFVRVIVYLRNWLFGALASGKES